MSIDFWTTENFGKFWGYIKMLLETIQPGIMLTVAAVAAGILIAIVVRIFKEAFSKDDNRSSDEDEDYEIRRY